MTSILTSLDALSSRIQDAYVALSAKGAVMPAVKNSANLSATVDTITSTAPTGNIQLTSMAQTDVSQYATAQVVDSDLVAGNIKSGINILGIQGSLTPGITPSGNINITTMNQTDVTNYATAQVVDANIVAGNIKKNVAILGVTGSYEGSGGGGGSSGHTLTVILGQEQDTSDQEIVKAYKSDGTYVEYRASADASHTYVVQDVVYFELYNLDYGGMYITYPDIGQKNTSNSRAAGSIEGIRYYVLSDGITIQPYYDSGCFLKGTKITLSNGLEKNAEDITFDDELLVWDFDNGCLSKAKPIWIQRKMNYDYYFLNKYKSGKIFKTTGKMGSGFGHRVFNMDKKKFIYDVESIGSRVYTLDGIDLHMSCERIDEPCEYYNIITEGHFNLFANRLLTSCSLNNIYEFDVNNMKFIKDGRTLRTISDYDNIPQHWFDKLRLSENNTNVDELNKYVGRLMASNKEGEIQC